MALLYFAAAGNKLSKAVLENNVTVNYTGTNYTSNITTTTIYLGGLVYESKDYILTTLNPLDYTYKLQFIGQEEGRIRYKPENTSLEYDYMIKDHLGNVRMVLTEEQQTDAYPAATQEAATIANESVPFHAECSPTFTGDVSDGLVRLGCGTRRATEQKSVN